MRSADPKPIAWTPVLIAVALAVSRQPGNAQVASQPAGQEDVARTGSIVSGQFRLGYLVEGTGTPTIVIGSPTYYTRAFSKNPHLREHLRLVFLDHRASVPAPGPVDITEFALDILLDDIELARETLRLGRVAVIGHSGHAYMALEYAKKYPANVSHVIMIGISPSLSAANAEATEQAWQELATPERKAVMEENLQRVPEEDLAPLPPREQLVKRYVRDGPRIWYDPRFDSSSLWEGVELNMEATAYLWGQVFRDIDVTRGLDGFDRPVFLALGRYDFLIGPPSHWDPISSKFRDLTVRVFEQSGHTPQYEEPALFDEELLAWMKEHQ